MKTILPLKSNYGGKRTSTKYLVVHYTASPDGTAEANAKYFATGERGASAHYFVGLNGEIVSSVPEDSVAWHCGASKYKHKEARNSNSIGVELCCKKLSHATKNASDTDWYFTVETVDGAVKFIGQLMAKYNIDIDHVIRHYDVTGKICPAPYVHSELQWEYFKDLCNQFYNIYKKTGTALEERTDVPSTPVPVPNLDSVSSFKVRLKETMNIRKGPSTSYGKNGTAPVGVYTITETNGDWGKLKSGAGWININKKYAERV